MATFTLLIVLLVLALWTRNRILRGDGFLRNRSPGQRQRIAKVSDAGFAALGIFILIASLLSGFVSASHPASDAVPLALLGLIVVLLPLLHDLLAYAVLKLERRVRVGDYVECDRVRGHVEQLSVRSTLVRTLEGCAVAIPNRYLLAHPLHHWSLGNRASRIAVSVEVSDTLNPAQVKEMLLECTRNATLIQSEPPPDVMFLGWRGGHLHFQLRAWIADRSLETEAISQLNYPIARRLRAEVHNSTRAGFDSEPATPTAAIPSGSLVTPPPADVEPPDSPSPGECP